MADRFDVPTMSYAHKNEFERIEVEHDNVVKLLNALPKTRQKVKPGSPPVSFDANFSAAAKATADDAYAFLLIATAEGFMRTYLASLNMQRGTESNLNTLIGRCRKEFNMTNPKVPIHPKIVGQVQDLRAQRNAYAHGAGSHVFPDIKSIVSTLGRFFDQLP